MSATPLVVQMPGEHAPVVASSHHVLTVSIGVATANRRVIETSRELVNAPDRASYEAKDAGRHRVMCYRAAGSTSIAGIDVAPNAMPNAGVTNADVPAET